MSRENRMLVMFFVGMVGLFTYFRVQYPNLGRVEDLRPAERTPELRVAGNAELIAHLEKAIRPYELEFGIRVFLEERQEGGTISPEVDLLVGDAEEDFPSDAEIVYQLDSGYVPQATKSMEASRLRFGVRRVSDARQIGAVRLTRFLVAKDRGALAINRDPPEGMWLDPWVEEPQPALAVGEAAYSLFKEDLGRFEALEGIGLQLIVGDCALVSRKASGEEPVDGILVIGHRCLDDQLEDPWVSLALPDLRPLIFSNDSIPSGAKLDAAIGNDSIEIGTLKGLAPLSGLLSGGDWIGRWEKTVNPSEWLSFGQATDLGIGSRQNQRVLGITLAYSTDSVDADWNTEWAAGTASVRLLINGESSYRHLLARLAEVVATPASP